jgi:hypothetical protein
MRNTPDVTGGKPIVVWLQSITGRNAVNPLVAFYDIHGRRRCYSFLSRTPQETIFWILEFYSEVQFVQIETQVVIWFHLRGFLNLKVDVTPHNWLRWNGQGLRIFTIFHSLSLGNIINITRAAPFHALIQHALYDPNIIHFQHSYKRVPLSYNLYFDSMLVWSTRSPIAEAKQRLLSVIGWLKFINSSYSVLRKAH